MFAFVDMAIAKSGENTEDANITSSRYLMIVDGKITNAISIANVLPGHPSYHKYQYTPPNGVTLLLDDEGKYDIGWEWDESAQDYIDKNPLKPAFTPLDSNNTMVIL